MDASLVLGLTVILGGFIGASLLIISFLVDTNGSSLPTNKHVGLQSINISLTLLLLSLLGTWLLE